MEEELCAKPVHWLTDSMSCLYFQEEGRVMNGEEGPESIPKYIYRLHWLGNTVQQHQAKSGKKDIVMVDHILSAVRPSWLTLFDR